MGNDEHGPAYPEPRVYAYHCPICGGNKDRYLECEYPGCPDGRDQPRFDMLRATYDPYEEPNEWQKSQPVNPWPQILSAAITALIVTLFLFAFTNRAPAMDHGFDPTNKTVQWFESKIRPDSPPNSCCGKGDAYPVERYELHPELHEVWVWVSDGSAMKYPDGTTRDYWDMSTKIVVPDTKVNPPDDDLDNPTDVSWIFMRVSTPTDVGTIYCFIPHPSGY